MNTFYTFIRNILPQGQSKKLAGMAMLFVMALWLPGRVFAQAPAISYITPQTFVSGTAITALTPANTGGAAGPFGYGAPILVPTGITDPVCMVMDKSGNIYIGESSGQVAVLAPGSSSATVFATGFGPVNELALDASNNVYLADGTHVWKIPAGGGTPVTIGSFSSPDCVAVEADGDLFVGDKNYGDGFFHVSPAGDILHDMGTASPPGIGSPTNVLIDGAGDMVVADNNFGGLMVGYPATEYSSFAGGGVQVYSYGLTGITFLAIDPAGNIFLTDNAGIQRFSPANSSLITITATAAKGLMTDANFILYYADGHNIYKMAPNGYFTTSLPPGLSLDASSGAISGTPNTVAPATGYSVTAYNAFGSSTANINITVNPALPALSYSSPKSYQVGMAISALSPSSSNVTSWGYSNNTTAIGTFFQAPTDVVADAAGNIYVAEFGKGQLNKIPAGGGATVVVASGFSGPFGLAIDAAGNLYITDSGNNLVKEIVAGTSTVNIIGSGFNAPAALAVDGLGNVYVGDTGNGALKKIPAGNGTPVTLQTGFTSIQGITVDAAGNIYVADAGTGSNGAVYKVPPGGGSMISIGTGFSRPSGITVDAGGNLYVSDLNHTFVTVIKPDGTQFSIASGVVRVNGVALDVQGNLYMADTGTGFVEKVKINGGYFLSPMLPAGLTFSNSTGVISGTPTAPSPTATYTVTGWNVTGSASATVSITVGAPIISYTSPVACVLGAAITPLTPAVSGGAVASPAYGPVVTVSTGISDATCLTMDKAGNMYIGQSSGKVSVLAPGASTATVYATGFATDGTLTPEGIAADASGNVYFADGSSLWKLPAGGGAAATLGGFTLAQSVALDAAGNIYVAGSSAGAGIFKMQADGSGLTKISSLNAQGLTIDTNGNLFALDLNATVYEIPVGGAQKSLRELNSPLAITADASGNVYVADFGGTVSLDVFPADGSARLGIVPNFNSSGTVGLFVGSNYNLYIANGTVTKLSPTGGYFINPELPGGLTINSTSGTISGTPTTASPAANYTVKAFNTSASTTATVSIAVGPAPAISYSTPPTFTAGTAISPLLPTSTGAAVGTPAFNSTIVPVGTGITDATCTAMDKNGNLYFGESSGKVSVLAPGNTTATVLATGFSTRSVNGGIAVDASGNVYFADLVSVWKIPAGGGAPVQLNSFEQPHQVILDGAGHLYVSDFLRGIYQMATDGSGKTQIYNGGVTISAADQNGNAYYSFRGSLTGLYEVPKGGSPTAIISGVSFRAFTTDPSGNVYMINGDNSVGMVPLGGNTESQVLRAVAGTTSIMIGTDLNLYSVVNGVIMKTSPSGGYFISQELPAGLTINPTSGAISGTPAAASPATNYTVTAYSGSVGATAAVNIKVNPALSGDATLSNLSLNAGLLLTPSFSPDVMAYTRNLVNGVQAVTIVPTTNESHATILINGTTALASGTRSSPIPVSVGSNIITIKVTAQDGVTTNTYTLTLNRAGARNDLLKSLKTSRGVLSPVFAGTTTSYTASVAGGVTSMTVTPTAADPNATIVVNGTDVVTSGTASAPIALLPGQNTITTTVIAQNDTATRTYTLTVTRETSKNDLLSLLKLSAGVKDPIFQANVLNYTASVVNNVSSITVTATASDPNATLKLDGQVPLTSGVTSGPIPLAVGPNTVTVTVKAPDGFTNQTYTVTITRAAPPAAFAEDAYQPVAVEKPIETPVLNDDGLLVHQGISPNGDGINDFLVIDNIAQYPDNKLSVINRNGQLIFEAKGYDNATKVFDGHSNKTGQMQLPGTYFYQLDYTVNGVIKHRTGYLVLKY